MSAARPRLPNFPLIGFIWFVAALAVGASGRLIEWAPPRPQLLLVALTVALVAAGAVVPSFREWLEDLDLRAVIAMHLTRFIGIYFLVLYSRGLLPYNFAVLGGWGDIAIAATAALWLVAAKDPAEHRTLLWTWNIAGALDILFVVATAARMGAADPDSMGPLRVLPLSLLPTFLVPLIIASHALIFWRLLVLRDRQRHAPFS